MPHPPDENHKLLMFPGNRAPAELVIPAELDDPDALHQYLLQQYDCFTTVDLQQLMTLLYREIKDCRMLVPTQQKLVREEIFASGQGELAYMFNILYRKYHLMQEIETALPCGIETFTRSLAPDGVTTILTPNENLALFCTPEPPSVAVPDADTLRKLGIAVHHPPLAYQTLHHPSQKLRIQALATPAFQAWFDTNLWLADSLVFLHDEMCLSARTRFFRFELEIRRGEPWNTCYDALTGQLINMSALSQREGEPAQLPVTQIYFDDAHAAFLHASDVSFPNKITPFR